MAATPSIRSTLFAATCLGAIFVSTGLMSFAHAQDDSYEVSALPTEIAAIGTGELDCDLDDAIPSFGFQALELEDGGTLFNVPCQTADVNIEAYIAKLEPDGGVTVFSFATEPGDNAEAYKTAINPEVLKNGLIVRSNSFYGPDANCGVLDTHELSEDGTAYDLVERREKTDCSGDYIPPVTYPVIWSAN
ncbi:hypothetical protein [Roseibium algae]|uniref:Uncharacterized protein n=1 Tax=Roseibium algae TaxID=3123038 RepID=A0ABU8TM74_9HYPH